MKAPRKQKEAYGLLLEEEIKKDENLNGLELHRLLNLSFGGVCSARQSKIAPLLPLG